MKAVMRLAAIQSEAIQRPLFWRDIKTMRTHPESLKSKTGCRCVKSFPYPSINQLDGFAFQGFYSEAASPNRRSSQQYLNTPHLTGLRRGLAGNYRKKSFAFSKKLLCIGLLSSPQEA